MKNEGEFTGQIIISKKNKKIDEEEPVKKGKKSRKQHQNSALKPQQPIKHLNNNDAREQDQKIKQRAIILANLCSILKDHNPKTIQKVLIKTNYDQQMAMEQLLEIEPDGVKVQEPKKKETIINISKQVHHQHQNGYKKVEAGNQLLNEIYDSEQINGQQFEQLFQQIAQMIKQDQRQKGVGMIQINSFMDECNQIKENLIVGFQEELANFQQFQFDQNNPLFTQTQLFIDKITKKQAALSQKEAQDFPTLGSSVKSNGKKNIFQKIQAENKKKKTQNQHFFVKNNNNMTQSYQKSNQQSIFNIDNRLHSQRDMMILHKQFCDVPINDLKFIYKTLATDLNLSRQFLIQYYNQKRTQKVYQQPVKVFKPTITKNYSKMKYQQIDRDIQHLSYDQIRNQLDHLFKMRQVLQMTRTRIKNQNQRQQLDRIINQKSPLIKKLVVASRVCLVKNMSIKDPQYADLHSYREQQVQPLLDNIIDMIRSQASHGNSKIKIKNVRGKGQGTVCLTIMTGKGLHSRGQKSILKPLVASWCNRRDFQYDEQQDHIKVYVSI